MLDVINRSTHKDFKQTENFFLASTQSREGGETAERICLDFFQIPSSYDGRGEGGTFFTGR